ncbi:transcriptional regulator, MarR family [Microscilla marina ATCC 23134]|uniref:Transcriptional regulator, MarR family n=2 Tax=Microscilla marina TaxID=1027 RepID=A1ZDN1_MICM2|nr:transcriptional regulator, MarR family [Microscilla marina ATCC 23134]
MKVSIQNIVVYSSIPPQTIKQMEETSKKCTTTATSCGQQLLAIRDALDIFSGKWKIPILSVLYYYQKRGFKDLQRDVTGITARMLSKELKELEMNLLVKRHVLDTRPVKVEYEITPYGVSSSKIIQEFYNWGATHRKKIMTTEK